ncbi:hypothetical protein Hdeb2414_s0014g00426601 [Helianthus debilis subsp. tardiflorus]
MEPLGSAKIQHVWVASVDGGHSEYGCTGEPGFIFLRRLMSHLQELSRIDGPFSFFLFRCQRGEETSCCMAANASLLA